MKFLKDFWEYSFCSVDTRSQRKSSSGAVSEKKTLVDWRTEFLELFLKEIVKQIWKESIENFSKESLHNIKESYKVLLKASPGNFIKKSLENFWRKIITKSWWSLCREPYLPEYLEFWTISPKSYRKRSRHYNEQTACYISSAFVNFFRVFFSLRFRWWFGRCYAIRIVLRVKECLCPCEFYYCYWKEV